MHAFIMVDGWTRWLIMGEGADSDSSAATIDLTEIKREYEEESKRKEARLKQARETPSPSCLEILAQLKVPAIALASFSAALITGTYLALKIMEYQQEIRITEYWQLYQK